MPRANGSGNCQLRWIRCWVKINIFNIGSMTDLIAESEEFMDTPISLQLLSSYNFWFKHRLLFNILVGVAGLIPTMMHMIFITVADIIGIIIWGFTANAFYSIGYSTESFFIIRTQGITKFKSYRSSLFWLGTLAYAFVSFLFAWMYFTFHASQFWNDFFTCICAEREVW